MNKNTRRFIRALGEQIAIQVITEDLGENSIALKFPLKFAYHFADIFDELFLEFGAHGLPGRGQDKLLYDFFLALHGGVQNPQFPYEDFRNERRIEAAETVWITFHFEVNLYLAAQALFNMLELYTEAWEADLK